VSKAYVDSILASMPDLLFVVNTDSTIRSINRAVSKRMGYREEELIGERLDVLFGSDEVEAGRLIAEGEKTLEVDVVTKDGHPIVLSLSVSLWHNAHRDVDGIICVARDVTEHKRAEEQRLRLEELVAELSTPLIPISDDIVVMPLIGVVHAQ